MHLTDQIITTASYIRQPAKRKTIKIAKDFTGQKGLEIGGPSAFFQRKGFCPVYLYAASVDGVNFGNFTIWEGQLKAGKNYRYATGKPNGYQYIDEASLLGSVPNNTYDFILSCHSLEHVANPIKTLYRWKEVLKQKGSVCIVLPDKRYTFDHNRPYTTLGHLIEDYQKQVDESDTTHFEEVIRLHDKSMDIAGLTDKGLKERVNDNFKVRSVHHHVFSAALIAELLEYCGFSVIYQQDCRPFHLFTYAIKK